jgi:hypothetical protein
MRKNSIVVNTPKAALAVRGTHFWAGPIEGKYGVLLLKGNVRVSGWWDSAAANKFAYTRIRDRRDWH